MVYHAVVGIGSGFSLPISTAKFDGQQTTCEESGQIIATRNGQVSGYPDGLHLLQRLLSNTQNVLEQGLQSRLVTSYQFNNIRHSILFSAAETDLLNNLITQTSQGTDFFLALDVEIHTSCQLQ